MILFRYCQVWFSVVFRIFASLFRDCLYLKMGLDLSDVWFNCSSSLRSRCQNKNRLQDSIRHARDLLGEMPVKDKEEGSRRCRGRFQITLQVWHLWKKRGKGRFGRKDARLKLISVLRSLGSSHANTALEQNPALGRSEEVWPLCEHGGGSKGVAAGAVTQLCSPQRVLKKEICAAHLHTWHAWAFSFSLLLTQCIPLDAPSESRWWFPDAFLGWPQIPIFVLLALWDWWKFCAAPQSLSQDFGSRKYLEVKSSAEHWAHLTRLPSVWDLVSLSALALEASFAFTWMLPVLGPAFLVVAHGWKSWFWNKLVHHR